MKHKRIILVGQAASGKDHIRKTFEAQGFKYAVSYTTRPPRPDEIAGQDYFFIKQPDAQDMIDKCEFYEWVVFNGWIYGTSLTNNLISNVQVNEFVPFYRDPLSVMNSSPLSGLQSVELVYGTTAYKYPFTCQASDAEQVGGFGWVKLDSYTTCISPCADPIPTPTPCI